MLDPDDAKKLAFAGAQDGAKQLVTLSTTIVAITITFFKDFATGSSDTSRYLMTIAWFLFVISIITGVTLLFTLTGELANAERGHDPSVMGLSSRIQAGAQQLTFLGAIIIAVLSGAWALWDQTPGTTQSSTQCCATTGVPSVARTTAVVPPSRPTPAPSERQLAPPTNSSAEPESPATP